MANDDSGLTFHALFPSPPLLFALATVAPSGTLLVDQPACWLADWLTYCCHNSSAQCWRSRRSFNYQAAGGVRGLHKESGELNGGFGQEVAQLTGQPFNYAVKHGQRPGSAAEAAVKPGTRKVIATAERWKGRSTTTTIVYGKRGLGLLKQVKRWKPVAKAHGKSYLLRLGNPGQQLRLGPCSPAAAHEFKMRRSSGPKLCFQRFYLRKISSRNTPSLPLSPPQPVLPSLPCSASWLFSFIGPSAVADLILFRMRSQAGNAVDMFQGKKIVEKISDSMTAGRDDTPGSRRKQAW